MTARGDSLGCSRNPGSNYYAGLTHQSMIDLGADDAAKVSVFHSLWVGKAGGELLRSSPPLAGASVLSASRFEPLVPCMGLSESSRDLSSPPLSFFRPIPLFDRGDHPFVPTRASFTSARAGAVKVGRRTPTLRHAPPLPPHLDSFEPDGTLGAIGMTIRGEPAFGRGSVAPQPCIRWVQGPEP